MIQLTLAVFEGWNISDRLMVVYVIVTAVAACAAVFTLFIIHGQLKIMQSQLDQMKSTATQTDALIVQATQQANSLVKAAVAAEKNAEAAILQSTALINSERPWIFVRFTISQNNASPMQGGKLFLPVDFTFDLINLGRTPAEILYFYGNYTIRPAREIDDITMSERDLLSEFEHKKILASEEPLNSFYKFYPSQSALTEDDFREIINSRMRLVFFGMIRYRDTLATSNAPSRETFYCYWYNPFMRDLVMGGPLGANRHT
jgi:hypothetical protein